MRIFRAAISRRFLFVLIAMTAVLILFVFPAFKDEPEISVIIGEPWIDMQRRSTAEIADVLPDTYWYQMPRTDARLRLADREYGFVTPLARFFIVAFTPTGTVRNVRLSPQIEPLLLEDTMQVLLGLQDQWRRSGWQPTRADEFPVFEDTPEWRAALRENGKIATYWIAGDQYEIQLYADRFDYSKRPDEERYLITMQLSRPLRID